jgi:hypothetical protein
LKRIYSAIEAENIAQPKKKGGRSDEIIMDENDLVLSGSSDVCDWHNAKGLCGVFPIRGHFHFDL